MERCRGRESKPPERRCTPATTEISLKRGRDEIERETERERVKREREFAHIDTHLERWKVDFAKQSTFHNICIVGLRCFNLIGEVTDSGEDPANANRRTPTPSRLRPRHYKHITERTTYSRIRMTLKRRKNKSK